MTDPNSNTNANSITANAPAKATFANTAELQALLETQGYVAGDALGTVLYLAVTLGKPLLVEGPAGVGKTELARALAACLGRELIRLQCYEGLDESKALYEWEYSKQLLYIQILKDKISDSFADAPTIKDAVLMLEKQEDAFFSERFLLARPLLKAVQAQDAAVLLIDEIDKSDPEFEAFLLEFLSDFAVTIPELGTFTAAVPPIVILTSNDERDLSDALKRRCLHLFIDYPELELEKRIISIKVPGADEALLDMALDFVQKMRAMELKKSPSISESIDWIRSLLALQITEWNHIEIRSTLAALLKYQSDVDHVAKALLK